MKKHKPFTIYPPPKLRTQIERRAQEKDRPMNWVTIKALERFFDRLEARQSTGATR